MKKSLGIILIITLLLLSLTSCKDSSPSIEECCNKVVSLMQDMVGSYSFSEFSDIPDQMSEIREKLNSEKRSKLSAVYEIDLSNVTSIFGGIDTNDNSAELNEYINALAYQTLASRIMVATCSDKEIAASSLYSVQLTFDCKGITDDTAFLYVYKDGTPILLTAIKGDADSIKVCGTFIISKDLADLHEMTQGEITELLEDEGLQGIKLTKVK